MLACRGIDVNPALLSNGHTPLMNAASEGLADFVAALVQMAGVRVNAQQSPGSGDTALSLACRKGHAEVARVLLMGGACRFKHVGECSQAGSRHWHARVVGWLIARVCVCACG